MLRRLALTLTFAALSAAPATSRAEPTPDLYRDGRVLYRLHYDAEALAKVEAFLALSPKPAWRPRAEYLRGVLLHRLGRSGEAADALRSLAERPGTLRDLARLHRARALAASGAAAEAVTVLAGLERAGLGTDGAVESARALDAAGRGSAAVEAWRAVLALKGMAVPHAEARYRLAVLLEGQGAADEAASYWKQLVVRHPHTSQAAEAARRVPVASLTDRDRYDRATALWDAREYQPAIEAYEGLLDAPRYRDEAHHLIGRLYSERLRTRYDEAARHFEAATRAADRQLAGTSLYKLALVQGKLRQYDKALATLERFRTEHKDNPNHEEAGYEIGRHLVESGAFEKAATFIDGWSKTVTSDQAKFRWFAGWAWLRGKQYARAIGVFDSLAGSERTLVGDKALYWKAVALDALERRDEAVKTLDRLLRRFPFTYYGWLAAQALERWGQKTGVPDPDFSDVPPWPRDPWGTAVPKGDKARAALERVRDLVEVGELARAREAWGGASPVVRAAVGAAAHGRLEAALQHVLERFRSNRKDAMSRHSAVRSEYPTRQNLEAWRAIFPLAWSELARVAAEREGLPEAQLYAHMLQESGFGAELVSGAGAYGLIQILPSTARRIARDAGLPYAPQHLYDPGYNLRLGAVYLGALKRRFKGQLPLAIAAYNGGPLLLSFYMKQYPGLDLASFLESLPAHESRNYARKVMEHMHRYLALYFSRDVRRRLMTELLPGPLSYEELAEPDY